MTEGASRHLDPIRGFPLDEVVTTADIAIPQDPLDRVIGQHEAIELARIAAVQRRHLLLVGPPGTGKSMIAQALSLHLPPPKQEIRIVHNPENPERPLVDILDADRVAKELQGKESAAGEMIDPKEAPLPVAEKLGYKCVDCGIYSSPSEVFCPKCGVTKVPGREEVGSNNPFSDLLGGILEVTIAQLQPQQRVTTTRKRFGKEEVVVYERAGEMIGVLDQDALEKRRQIEAIRPSKRLVPIDRHRFILATGASEVELLGDVRHDPYGGHAQLGTQPYERVIAGAIHEAHEGILFVDELPHLGFLQRFILTAMQEKRFSILGRNPQSSGAAVKVEYVPCNFIFVGACNIADLHHILSPLRSRIIGSGYEVLVATTMDDTETNRVQLAQFVAQEIAMDRKIPEADADALDAIIAEAARRAAEIDNHQGGLTLRLRELGGLVRTAGDIAVIAEEDIITKEHIKLGLKRSRTVEDQIKERYGSYEGGVARDLTGAQRAQRPDMFYWNPNRIDDGRGYG